LKRVIIEEIRMSRRRDSRERIYSCPECGNPYYAFPPDDIHTKASLDEPKPENAVSVKKVIHDCEKCKHPIEIYWYKPKIAVGII
jgi:DNA-directed RNA polymerase subunit M/transcription elongation factor TFIIS